jgi:membrane-bound serine protease (ClpP class)
LNGRSVHTPARDVMLSLAGAPQLLEMTWRERLLNTLANPNVAYLLFLLGVLALIAEIFAPHGMVTGTVGAVAIILAIIGLSNLPIQLYGALVLILGMILLVLELKITTHGVLTVVGLIAFIFGSVLLFPDIPGYHLSPWAIGSVAVLWAALLSVIVRLVLKARHGPKLVGVERLVGTVGVAKTDLAPRGVVLLGGEDWDAQADPSPVGRGEKVQVLEVQGLTLRVRKLS